MNEDYELYDPNNQDHNNNELYEVVEHDENIGIKRTYSCYIDGNGNPQLQPFGEGEETDEVNGVEVTFPVKKEDFRKFREEAEKVYRPFEVKPNVTGNKDYEVKDFNVLLTSEESDTADWQLVEPISQDYGRDKLRVAVQGNIEYPINTDKISEFLSPNASKILYENFRLHFGIGELDIAASREELGYDKTTIDNIVAKLEKMASEIQRVQQEKIDSIENKYQAMKHVHKIRNSSNIYSNIQFQYKGQEISSNFSFNHNEFEVVKYSKNHRGNITRDGYKDSWKSTSSIQISDSIVLVYNDNGKKTQAASKARSLVTSGNTVILIHDLKIFDGLEGVEYLNASEIEIELDSVKKIIEKGKFFKEFYNSSTTSYQWNENYASANTLGLDLNEEFYYMEIKGSVSISGVDIHEYLSLGKNLGLIEDDIKVYGANSTHVVTKKFKTYKAIEFVEFIKEQFKSSDTFAEKVQELGSYATFNKIQNEMNSEFLDLINSEHFDNLPEDNILREIKEDYAKATEEVKHQDRNTSKRIKDMATRLGFEIPNSEYDKHIGLDKKYPLVNSLNWRFNKKDFVNYIKGQDLLEKLMAESDSANSDKDEELSESEVA